MAFSSRRSYLYLQKIIATDTLVMHLVVGIVSIATALVLDKCEAACVVSIHDRPRLGQVCTHSLLEAVRGAGISQRTRRPYLRVLSIHVFDCRAAGVGRARERSSEDSMVGRGIRSVIRRRWEGGIAAGIEHHRRVTVWALEDGRLVAGDWLVTYRSNSKARSRARVPWPKPVT